MKSDVVPDSRLISRRSARPSLPVVTFSHFVPRADLLPDYDRLKFKELIDVSISEGLEPLIREAGCGNFDSFFVVFFLGDHFSAIRPRAVLICSP